MRLLLVLLLVCGVGVAEDKTPVDKTQPTAEERFDLMQAQRDFLLATNLVAQAQTKQQQVGAELDRKAQVIAAKYHCKSWNSDFTCVPEAPTETEKPVTASPAKTAVPPAK